MPGKAVPLTRSQLMNQSSSSPALAGKLRPGDRPGSPSARSGRSSAIGSTLGSPRVRHTNTLAILNGTAAAGASKAMQMMRLEHREDIGTESRAKMLSKVAPPLSRFRGEDEEMRTLSRILQRSARERSAAVLALESVERDFERDFPASGGQRFAVGQLVARSAQISAKLEATCRSLEAAAGASLATSQHGAIEREATIRALQHELECGEQEMTNEVLAAQYHLTLENQLLQRQARATERVLLVDLRRAEHLIERRDDIIEELRVFKEEEQNNRELTIEEERIQLVEHLQNVSVRRMLKMDLARGWTAWMALFKHLTNLKRRAGSRFRNAALHACIRKWVHEYPPKGSIRRVVEPLEEQIRDLDRALTGVREQLKKEKEAHKWAQERLDEASGKASKEKEMRVAHLMRIAVQRIMMLELSRGWSTWHAEVKRTRAMRDRAIKRFSNQGLFRGWNAWVKKHPPAGKAENFELAIKRERKAHERTKALLAERTRERDAAREHARETSRLQMIVRELQRVLAEAMMASSWVACRQILYHESLRYVPTAATHGKMLPKAVRKEIMRADPDAPGTTGRQVSGGMIRSVLEEGNMRRSMQAEAWAESQGADALQDLNDKALMTQEARAREGGGEETAQDLAAEPEAASVSIMKRMLEDSEQAAQIRVAQQAAEEKRKTTRIELELKSGTAKEDAAIAARVGPLTLRPSGGSPDANPMNRPRVGDTVF